MWVEQRHFADKISTNMINQLRFSSKHRSRTNASTSEISHESTKSDGDRKYWGKILPSCVLLSEEAGLSVTWA